MAIPGCSGLFHTSYKQDMALCNTPFRRFWVIVLIISIVAFPFFVSNYYVQLLNLVSIFLIVSLSLQLVTGYCGLISIGHAGIMGGGAFLTAFMTQEFSAPFWLVILSVALLGLVIGVIVSLPLMRVKGVYSVMSTLAMHFIILCWAAEYQRLKGAMAGFSIPNPQLGPFILSTLRQWYFFLIVLVALITLLCINLVGTRPGRAWMAIRDRDIAAAALGVNVFSYKLQVFMLSSMLTTIAGSLYAYNLNFTDVGEFSIWKGVMFLGMIVTGGMGSILGAIFGAFFITLLPYAIEVIFEAIAVPTFLKTYIFGVQFGMIGLLIILFLLFEPRGLVGIWVRLRTFFQLWPYKYRRVVATTR